MIIFQTAHVVQTTATSRIARFLIFAVLAVLLLPSVSFAASAREIDASVQDALEHFRNEVKGAGSLLSEAKGILVMPRVIKAGIGIGGEYGEGALLERGITLGYYNIISASWGFQLGAQKKTIILLFMQPDALKKFQDSSGWKAGVDASVALIKVGADGSVDTKTANQPVLGFVIGQKGLMYNLSLEGSKFTRISK